MPSPPPLNETQRLVTLRGLDILDTLPEERFDRITRLARRVFGVPFATITMIDADRQWFKSRQGLDITETPREVSFCTHAVDADALLVVPDAGADERFRDNPFVVGDPSVRFYAGCPVHAGPGHAVGTLCVIDTQPRQLSEQDIATLRDLAAMVEDELHSLTTATTDQLTRLSNRRGFDTLGGHALALSRRFGEPMTLLVFDLVGFKPINDQLGHAVGDRALVDFAAALLKTFREADVVARTGGDEFCVLATGLPEAAAAPLARLARHLDALTDRPYRLAFSVGAASYEPDRHPGLDALFAEADQAMYAARRTAR